MFGKLRKLLGANSPAPQQKVTAQAQRLQPKQQIQQLSVQPNFGRQTNQVNPVDMDSIPGNMQFGNNAAYYQGSNPFQNQPRKNIYQNMSPMPVDEMRFSRQIQPSGDSFNPWY